MGTPSMMMKTLVMTLTTLTTLMKTMKRICLRMDDMPIPRTRKTFLPSSRGGGDGDAWDTNPKEDEFTNCLAKPIMKYNGGGGGDDGGDKDPYLEDWSDYEAIDKDGDDGNNQN